MFRTPTQRKVCQECPIAKTANLVGDSTTLLIVRDLSRGAKGFSELVTLLPKVSTRTLTNKLKNLENEGVLIRQEKSGFPPRVTYSLTTKGRGLAPVINALGQYGKKYL